KGFYALLFCFFFMEGMIAQEVCSPDGALKVKLTQEAEAPEYEVEYRGKTLLERSPLGLETSIGDFATNLRYGGSATRQVDE
ncbi:glycoside hydrolase family 97 N-terminal domain-containing protein, partial [Streptococcus pyogenes]